MTSTEAQISAEISRLELRRGNCATKDDLTRMASRAGIRLPPSFVYFMTRFGACEGSLDVGVGPQEGRLVVFSEPVDIFDDLRGMRSLGILPFAHCRAGNFYALRKADPEPAVIFIDLDQYRCDPMFETFLDFLKGLRVVDWTQYTPKHPKTEKPAEGTAESIIAILTARGVPLSEPQKRTITTTTDEAKLDRWIVDAAICSSADELFNRKNRKDSEPS
jgi:hypothetical protein